MRIREATQADLPFIVAANVALASETEGQTLDGALLGPGVQAVLDDPATAPGEIARVLKPGGWIAAAVWSAPEKNPSLGIAMNAIKQVVELPPPDPAAPGIFRLAQPGDLADMLRQAGLTDVAEQEFLAEWSYASADEYYTSLTELAAPIQNLLAKFSPDQLREVKRHIVQAISRFQRGDRITLPFAVRMVAARKPV
mgnify:CR=1 FL=1